MKGFTLAFLVGAVLCVPAGIVGKALDFGGLAWLGTFVAIMLVAGLADREGFYGPRKPG